jgi:hypothetical protein
MTIVRKPTLCLQAIGIVASLLCGRSPAQAQEPFLLTSPADTLPDLPPLPPKRAPKTHIFLIPGYLLSLSPGVASHSYSDGNKTTTQDIATGHGLELSLSFVPPKSLYTYGFFTQAQRFFSYNGDHSRYAAGVQGSVLIFGGEAGFAYRGADDYRRATPQALLGTYLGMIFFNFGLQVAIPLVGGDKEGRPAHALEATLLFSFKAPIPL